jgi:hypothetical protein
MPAMTAKQNFRDGKFGDEKSVTAGSKSIAAVIQLARKIPTSPYRGTVGPDAPQSAKTERDVQDDSDLPSFPGESWFGG